MLLKFNQLSYSRFLGLNMKQLINSKWNTESCLGEQKNC